MSRPIRDLTPLPDLLHGAAFAGPSVAPLITAWLFETERHALTYGVDIFRIVG